MTTIYNYQCPICNKIAMTNHNVTICLVGDYDWECDGYHVLYVTKERRGLYYKLI